MTLQWLANVVWWCAQATYRDKKKLADKERKQIEEAARAKVAALQDDDNVFDVAYEQQGGAGEASDVLSATDIKVCLCYAAHSVSPQCCCASRIVPLLRKGCPCDPGCNFHHVYLVHSGQQGLATLECTESIRLASVVSYATS